MKALVFFVVALSGLACARAQFSPIAGQDSSAPKADASSCPAHEPKPSCDSQIASGASCDPVCQAGTCDDWCTQKCSVAGDGNTVCSSKGAVGTFLACKIWNQDLSSQYDNCDSGDICLPIAGSGSSYCFTHCHSSVDCKGSATATPCTERSLSIRSGPTAVQVRVCDPPYSKCDSAAVGGGCCNPASNTGCGDNQTCYLVPPSLNTPDPKALDNLTVCDFTEKFGLKGAPCSSVRDCADRFSCGSTSVCQQVCDPNNPTNPCPGGVACVAVGKQFGFCP